MPVHTPPFSKGLVLHFKRAPFTLQKDSFYTPKGLLLQCKRTRFATQKDSFLKATEISAENQWITGPEKAGYRTLINRIVAETGTMKT